MTRINHKVLVDGKQVGILKCEPDDHDAKIKHAKEIMARKIIKPRRTWRERWQRLIGFYGN